MSPVEYLARVPVDGGLGWSELHIALLHLLLNQSELLPDGPPLNVVVHLHCPVQAVLVSTELIKLPEDLNHLAWELPGGELCPEMLHLHQGGEEVPAKVDTQRSVLLIPDQQRPVQVFCSQVLNCL